MILKLIAHSIAKNHQSIPNLDWLMVFILSATQKLTATHGTLLLKRASKLQQLPLNLKSPIILSSR